MKPILTGTNRCFMALLIAVTSAIPLLSVTAQVCTSPSTQVYGLTSAGGIYPVTIATGAVGAVITPAYPGNAPSASNGLGYNSVNGKFYYFKRNADVSPQEFVSFDPTSNTISILASCPTTNTIHTGCASVNGLGFYALDVNGNLFYYSVSLNSWILITSAFRNQSNTNIIPILRSQSSGDIAIDGNGNLWILTSNSTNYGLYKVSAPLPTTTVTRVTATQVVAPTATTPTGNSFTGIAFNPTGQIILATAADDRLYRLENDLSLSFLGNLSLTGIGNDLTSCSYPLWVLPVVWQHFNVTTAGRHAVQLSWNAGHRPDGGGYDVEHSRDGASWEGIGHVAAGAQDDYHFLHAGAGAGYHYYRIHATGGGGEDSYSPTRTIALGTTGAMAVWPNPVSDIVFVQNNRGSGALARIFDPMGRQVYAATLRPGINRIAVNTLPAGVYVITIVPGAGEVYTGKMVKQ